MSGSSEKWFRRDGVPSVTLAPQQPFVLQPPPAKPGLVSRDQIGPESERLIRLMASVFPGTRVAINGIFHPIKP